MGEDGLAAALAALEISTLAPVLADELGVSTLADLQCLELEDLNDLAAVGVRPCRARATLLVLHFMPASQPCTHTEWLALAWASLTHSRPGPSCATAAIAAGCTLCQSSRRDDTCLLCCGLCALTGTVTMDCCWSRCRL